MLQNDVSCVFDLKPEVTSNTEWHSLSNSLNRWKVFRKVRTKLSPPLEWLERDDENGAKIWLQFWKLFSFANYFCTRRLNKLKATVTFDFAKIILPFNFRFKGQASCVWTTRTVFRPKFKVRAFRGRERVQHFQSLLFVGRVLLEEWAKQAAN